MVNIEAVNNVTNEILFVGAVYKNPELLVDYIQLVKSKYDFYDEATDYIFVGDENRKGATYHPGRHDRTVPDRPLPAE